MSPKKAVKRKKALEFLFEMGCEEIPASIVNSVLAQFKEALAARLEENEIKFKEIISYGTPRRFVLYIKGLSDRQPDKTVEITGPAKKVAYDDNGVPTKACEGFARSNGVKVDSLEVKDTPKGEYVVLSKLQKGVKTSEFLKEAISQIVTQIHLPKKMKWQDSDLDFSRPIRWILALLDNDILDVKVAGLSSAKLTYLRGYAEGRTAKVASIKDYFSIIKAESAILDFDKRMHKIQQQLDKIAAKENARVYQEEGLLEETANITESPYAFLGEFSSKYLELPREVILCSLSKYQRLFAMYSSKGKLKPKFLGVLDKKQASLTEIRRNFEKVLEARLTDSLFFYKEDLKTSLSNYRDGLKKLIFHQDLGSVYDKTERMKTISDNLCELLSVEEDLKNKCARAAQLSKSDLPTNMVKEFPSLQGVMGCYYAMASGEEHTIATAIGEQYLPKNPEGALPKSFAGSVLALADKLDLIVGCFSVGILPTGSMDPYGIRRAGSGFVSIVLKNSFEFSLDELLDRILPLFGSMMKSSPDSVKRQIKEFFAERMKARFIQSKFRYDLVDAVVAGGVDRLYGAQERLKALKAMVDKESFLRSWKVVERTRNILKGAKTDCPSRPSQELFTDELETKLFAAFAEGVCGFEQAVAEGDYIKATDIYQGAVYEHLNDFFDNVLVNVEQDDIRKNRLALMKAIHDMYTLNIADISCVVMQKEQKEKL